MHAYLGTFHYHASLPLAKSTVSMLMVIALYGCSGSQESTSENSLNKVPTAFLPANVASAGEAVRFESTSDESFLGVVEQDGKTTITWTPTQARTYDIYRRKLPQGSSVGLRNRTAQANLCDDTVFQDGADGASSVPAGYSYIGTVDDNGFVDTSITDQGLYRYLVLGFDDADNEEVVAQDLTVRVTAVASLPAPEQPTSTDSVPETSVAESVPAAGAALPDVDELDAGNVQPDIASEAVNPFEPIESEVAEAPDQLAVVDVTPTDPDPAPVAEVPVSESGSGIDVVPLEPESVAEVSPAEPAAEVAAVESAPTPTLEPEPVAEVTPVEPAAEPVAEVTPVEPAAESVAEVASVVPDQLPDVEQALTGSEPDSEQTQVKPIAESVVGQTPVESQSTQTAEPTIEAAVAPTDSGEESGNSAQVSECEAPVGDVVPSEAAAELGRETLDPAPDEEIVVQGEYDAEAPPTTSVEDAGSGGVPVAPGATHGEDGRLLAFPGATGHGRYAKGGRGGRVVIVDTLADVVDAGDGKTSLREALEVMSGPRTIVFAVGGVFETIRGGKVGGVLTMLGEKGSNVTVACQTAPSPGVIIKGSGIRIKGAHDVIMRHCVIRNIDPGSPLAESNRTIGVLGSSAPNSDMIFDHMSLSWATDENFTVFVGPTTKASSRNFTLSNSIVSEGDADSAHPESGRLPQRTLHSMGPSCGSSSSKYRVEGCSIVSNLMAHNGRRNPLMWGISGEFVNNVVYNWHETATDARPHFNGLLEVHVVGNIYKAGPTSKAGNSPLKVFGETHNASYVVKNNIELAYPSGGSKKHVDRSVSDVPFPMSKVDSFNHRCVGATRPVRDQIDDRVVSDFINGTGRVGIFFDNNRDYSMYQNSAHGPQYDTDKDGMEDSWELANGLDSSDSEDFSADRDNDGFSNLEEFINDRARCIE